MSLAFRYFGTLVNLLYCEHCVLFSFIQRVLHDKNAVKKQYDCIVELLTSDSNYNTLESMQRVCGLRERELDNSQSRLLKYLPGTAA